MARPLYKNPIDTINEPIRMTPTLRQRLRKLGEGKRTDGIRWVHYDDPTGELYVAYRWPSGRVQWYRYITFVRITFRGPPRGRALEGVREQDGRGLRRR
jgi:hypothetical protein